MKNIINDKDNELEETHNNYRNVLYHSLIKHDRAFGDALSFASLFLVGILCAISVGFISFFNLTESLIFPIFISIVTSKSTPSITA